MPANEGLSGGEGLASCVQDTLKTSQCANRLFPTARLS